MVKFRFQNIAMKTIISTIIVALLSCISFVFAQQNTPSDFPKHQNTGNQKTDNAAYDQAKKAWIEANTEAYQKMGGQIESKPEIKEQAPVTEVENSDKKDNITDKISVENDTPTATSLNPQISVKTHTKQHGTHQPNCILPDDAKAIQLSDIHIIESSEELSTTEKTALEQRAKTNYETQKSQLILSDEPILYFIQEGRCVDSYPVIRKEKNSIIINVSEEGKEETLLLQLKFTPKL